MYRVSKRQALFNSDVFVKTSSEKLVSHVVKSRKEQKEEKIVSMKQKHREQLAPFHAKKNPLPNTRQQKNPITITQLTNFNH